MLGLTLTLTLTLTLSLTPTQTLTQTLTPTLTLTLTLILCLGRPRSSEMPELTGNIGRGSCRSALGCRGME